MRPVNFTHYTPIIPFPGRGRIAISRALARHVITRCPRRREWADEEGTLRPGVCVCCTPLRTAVHPRARAHAAVLISTFLAFSFPIRPYRRARARARTSAARLPMVKRVTREAFTDFIARRLYLPLDTITR